MPNGSSTTKITAHIVTNVVLVSGAATLTVTPDLFPDTADPVGDTFQLFKLNSVRFRILALSAGAAAGVVASAPNNPPTGSRDLVTQLYESVDHEANAELVWSRVVSCRKKTIAGPLSWYHTRLGTFDVTEFAPCTMVFSGTGANTVRAEIWANFEFTDLAPISSTPDGQLCVQEARRLVDKQDAEVKRTRLLMQLTNAQNPSQVPAAAMQIFKDIGSAPSPKFLDYCKRVLVAQGATVIMPVVPANPVVGL